MRAYIWIWHSPPGHVPATALHLKEKAQPRRLQGRRWRKWDTDSDSSDGSDDELDLAV